MVLETFEFYVENFNMVGPWVAASVLGGSVPVVVFITAIHWWRNCQHLWSTKEMETARSPLLASFTVHASTGWLVM
jgi:hypothetical protein